jgi:putative molybdopterin biosynthesis protein
MGSHDVALDMVVGGLAERGITVRTLAVGSLGGVAAAQRGECDLAPVHLVDPDTGVYNKHLLAPGLALVPGWRRMQGVLYRPGDMRFEGHTAADAIKTALADPTCLMVNRNAGAGTRVLIDELLARFQAEWAPVGRPESAPTIDSGARSDAKPVSTFAERAPGARPPGYSNQPRSHNAVAAAVAQARADWGVAIEPVARLYGLGFLPLAPEHYDFLLVEGRRERPAVQAFLAALREDRTKERIRALGMLPADD